MLLLTGNNTNECHSITTVGEFNLWLSSPACLCPVLLPSPPTRQMVAPPPLADPGSAGGGGEAIYPVSSLKGSFSFPLSPKRLLKRGHMVVGVSFSVLL